MTEKKTYWHKKRILVTGHQGFLGSWVTKTLVDSGAEVIGVDKAKAHPHSVVHELEQPFTSIRGNIANRATVKKIMIKFEPQFIFHLAAEAIVGRANKHPVKTFKSNIEGTWNILEEARLLDGLKAIVVASSDKAYGSHKKLPYTEEAALMGEHPYDVSKSCTDLICRSYAISFGLPVCITRCGNIYGPGDHNFSRLIPDAITRLLKGQTFDIRSDGRFTRDYIYVTDIVNAYLMLATNMKVKKLQGEAFNFSDEKPMSVIEVYRKIAQAIDKEVPEPRILNEAQHEIAHQYLSSKKARALGWRAKTGFDRGIRQTIKWYKRNT